MYTMKESLDIPIGNVKLKGDLNIPENAKALIIFAHGSGSSRLSSRNQYVSGVLEQKEFATLLFDLLTINEDKTYANRFEIELLTDRLIEVTKWVWQMPECSDLKTGYFGASTGAASALAAASLLGNSIKAVVSRGGRPDLALPYLNKVKCPVLLLVGSLDYGVIELNEQAYDALTSIHEIKLVPGATHLFEEPGKLEEVAKLATEWFSTYLPITNKIHV
jgi:putative phosphoribosyl transferase